MRNIKIISNRLNVKNMNKYFLLLLAVCICHIGFAQKQKFEKPDYKKIKSITDDKYSPFYYTKLIARYNISDTTLTKEEFRFLYYGCLYRDSYSPYNISHYSDSLKRYLSKDDLSNSDYDSIIKYENLILTETPFNIRDLNILSYVYEKKGNLDLSGVVDFKLKNIIETILSTGDGLKEESAFHVISIGHEYDLLNILGYKFGGEQALTVKGCDKLKLKENKKGIKELYFDVNEILAAESKMFKQK